MLFNKSDNGIAELKSILGFIYASNSFDNLKTDLMLTEDDMRLLLGNKLYEAVEAHYLSEDYQVDAQDDADFLFLDKLVEFVRQPIAFYAFRAYAAHSDVTHSDKGRQIFVSENEKPAFQWQVERDDQAMLYKAHRLTDRMLDFIEINKDQTFLEDNWTSEPAYQATKQLFLNSAREFQQVYPIDESRRFFLAVVPFIREVENTVMLAVLGSEKFQSLKVAIADGTTTADDARIIQLVKIPLALYTMVTALKRLGIEVLPNAVVENFNPGYFTIKATKTAGKDAKASLITSLEMEASKALISLQEQIAVLKALADGVQYVAQNLTDRNNSSNKHFRV
ncbi:MAG: DUF6712 family protein [Bacteroidota bacterium]